LSQIADPDNLSTGKAGKIFSDFRLISHSIFTLLNYVSKGEEKVVIMKA
jgi:hypothetical protein